MYSVPWWAELDNNDAVQQPIYSDLWWAECDNSDIVQTTYVTGWLICVQVARVRHVFSLWDLVGYWREGEEEEVGEGGGGVLRFGLGPESVGVEGKAARGACEAPA